MESDKKYRLRFFGEIETDYFHAIRPTSGKHTFPYCESEGKFASANPCPHCASGNRPISRHYVNVIDREDGEIKLLMMTQYLLKTVSDYANAAGIRPADYSKGATLEIILRSSMKRPPVYEIEMISRDTVPRTIKPLVYARMIRPILSSSPQAPKEPFKPEFDLDKILATL